MSIGFKKVFAGFLLTVVFATTASAQGNYTQVQTTEEYYNASSPIGTFAQYPQGAAVYNAGYVPVSFNSAVLSAQPAEVVPAPTIITTPAVANSYTYAQPMPASYQKIEVPQNYDRKVVTTNSYIDERQPIDKFIDRGGKVVGILGIGALLTAGAVAIFSAL